MPSSPARETVRDRDGGPIEIVALGRRDYESVWREMRAHTLARDEATPDAIWLVEHPPVYTLGQAGRREHLLAPGAVPVVHSDRGGQVTYHGPGQAIAYVLLDLRRARLGVKRLVWVLEEAVIALLAGHGLAGARREGAPGVYVDGAKIAAIGLRVRDARSYHGVSLNVDLDLEPFSRIDPCGYPGLAVTRLADLGVDLDVDAAGAALADAIVRALAAARSPAR